ncbi:uncharacterized protein FMAN_05359 [Fusarium mangiferae]|uniref:Uncharacterized protein n=1 Tax=Fusarium mangiferae TaxID=192010 RepID=A0A1L7SWW7_FUSMA|nr:uncharacterized protein FMAN_05359 [Fusarium mangiferae]CVK87785.1 uncharacterized protein FMAN_05359 [Fusarium mangiferae]
MARKRNRKSKRAAKSKSKPKDLLFWSYTDRLELLAHLNWCVQYDQKFESTAIAYLKNATGKEFTSRRIRDKLKREWRNYGTCDDFDDLFSLGTAGLEEFKGQELQDFLEICSKFDPPADDQTWSRRLRSGSTAFPVRSRTLSVTRATGSREEYAPSSPQSIVLKKIQRKPKLRTRSQTRFEVTRGGRDACESDDELTRGEDLHKVKSESGSELSSISSPGSLDIELNFGPAIPDSRQSTVSDMAQTPPTSSDLANLRKAEAELLQQKGRVVSLIGQVSKLQYELDDLLRRQRIRATGSDQDMLRTTIFNLKQKAGARDHIFKCFEALETDNVAFAGTSLKQECNVLYFNLDDAGASICNMSPDDSLPGQTSEFSELSHSWARRISGRAMRGLLAHAQNVKITKNKLLACLLAVGIFETVFEPAFPEILGIDSPLFQQYRTLIATSAGTKILRSFDLAATRSLLNNPTVKEELLSEKGDWLCTLMLSSLTRFLPSASHDMAERSPVDLSEEEETLVIELKSNLSQALNIKLELALSVNRFQYYFFQPGSSFDSALMQHDTSNARDLAMGSKKIKICMFPAIFSVEGQTNELEKDIASDLGGNHNSVTEARSDDLKSLKVVAKARVLL